MARRILITLAALGAIAGPASGAFAQIPINIESVPPGATVYLDSTANPLGQTPLANTRVARGTHTLIFQLANHEEARLTVNVARRRETFRAVLRALGVIEVSAGNANAQGASVSVDGRTVGGTLGPVPIRVTDLQPGRHQVRVTREGFNDFEQWVEVGGGQVVRIAAVLERAAPDTGSILVSGPPGAPVFLDGTPRGQTPTVIEGVPPGPHSVDIRPPGQEAYSTTVTVIAGQRATVAMPSAQGGSLRVIASAPGAIISVDGEALGPSPATATNLAPGEHIVEARAEGYQPARQTVTVTAGQQRVVSLDMQAEQGSAGRIIVRANVEGASVLVDNQDRGTAPVVMTPEPGPHAIVVRADGHQEYSTTCETGPGRNCEVEARLTPQQVRVRVAVQPGLSGAMLLIDGQPVGPVPYDGTLPAGSHVMSVTAPGYEEFRQQVLLQPSGEARPFDITLRHMTDGLTEEQRQEYAEEQEARWGAAMTHSAAPLPEGQASIDVSVGWPYLGELRLNVGLHEFVDAGFAIRSIGRLTDFEGRLRVGFRPIEMVAIAGQARFGGGLGPSLNYGPDSGFEFIDCPVPDRPGAPPCAPDPMNPTRQRRMAHFGDETYTSRPNDPTSTPVSYPINSAFFSLDAIFSLLFGNEAAVSLWLGLDVTSDEYAGHSLNSSVYVRHSNSASVTRSDPPDYCVANATMPSQVSCPRDDWARARLGGSLELRLHRNWNLWFLLEGILNNSPRRVLGNLLGIEAADTQFYFRLGTTYKF
ncbi:MAG: PEGA domain-containing protein [Sandaracinaceae bacterium]|nr:PEGA domain-containing protein [Sandaracinaceae bacterium]